MSGTEYRALTYFCTVHDLRGYDVPQSPNPNIPHGWAFNPWYGGPATAGGITVPSHSFSDVFNAFGDLSAAEFATKTIAEWREYILESKFRKNPFPQKSIWDAPGGGTYIAQLVCAGSASGEGWLVGKVLFQYQYSAGEGFPGKETTPSKFDPTNTLYQFWLLQKEQQGSPFKFDLNKQME